MPDLKLESDTIPNARVEGDVVIAHVRGEIDLQNSPELRSALLEILAQTSPRRLILNLSQVPYMDSSAIAVLVESLKRISKQKGKICLTNLQPRVKSLLEIARLDSIFLIAQDEADGMTK
jgi:anti-sigma B factor antagonist